jgi:hypothetical protein
MKKNRFLTAETAEKTVINIIFAVVAITTAITGCEQSIGNSPKSSEKAITAFSINDVPGAITGTDIALTLPAGTGVTSLAPEITVSPKAAVSPASGTARDFSSPVTYTVTAEDGTAAQYTVTVTVSKSGEKAITAFSIYDLPGAIDGTNIVLTLPAGTGVTSLVPEIAVSSKAAVSPASGTARDFSSPVTYTVTAEDGSTAQYTVTVTVLKSGEKAITAFSINDVPGVITGTAIALTLPYGTDKTSLGPQITVSEKAAVSPASGAAQDFSSPVTYTVTAEDGTTSQYTVTVQVKGRAPIEITLPYEEIDLSAQEEGELSRTQRDTLEITVDGEPVRWFIDGEEQAETGSNISIAAIDYPVGIHHVTALVYKDGIPYSGELTFRVVK